MQIIFANMRKNSMKILQCTHININYTNKGSVTCEEKQEIQYHMTWPLFTSGYSQSDPFTKNAVD